jgi:transposase-like protein
MPDSSFSKKVICPWCERGEVLGTSETKGSVSMACPKCGRYFVANFNQCIGVKSKAVRRTAADKIKNVTD